MNLGRLVVACGILTFLYVGSPFLVPIFFSLFLAMLVDPLVERFVQDGFARQSVTYTIGALVLSLFAIIVAVFLLSIRDLLVTITSSPRLSGVLLNLKAEFLTLNSSVERVSTALFPESNVPKVDVIDHYPVWLLGLKSAFGSLFQLASFAAVVPLLLFYLIFEKENLIEGVNSILGRYVYLPTVNAELPRMVRNFFFANLLTSGLLITGQAVILYILRFPNWPALSFITGFLSLIPIVGAPAALALIVLTGISAIDNVITIGIAVIATILLHFVTTNFVLASVIGRRANINSTTIIIGTLFWSWIWGGVGFVIAVPMTLLIKILLESNSSTLPFANVMSSRPAALLDLVSQEFERPS